MSLSKKILIVEDEEPLARALELKLSHFGFDVRRACDGEEGLSALKKEKFDLILTDLIMPRLNGFLFITKVKAMEIKTPIIVASNLSQDEDIEKAKDAGAVKYFVKATTPIAQLVSEIRNYS